VPRLRSRPQGRCDVTAYRTSMERVAARKRAEDVLCAVFKRCLGWSHDQLADECMTALITSDDAWHPGPRAADPPREGTPTPPPAGWRAAKAATAARAAEATDRYRKADS
jgi:hypothetical protein